MTKLLKESVVYNKCSYCVIKGEVMRLSFLYHKANIQTIGMVSRRQMALSCFPKDLEMIIKRLKWKLRGYFIQALRLL